MLAAVGRVVTAVDAGTGDKAMLVRAKGPVCSLAVGNNGELVRGRRIAVFSVWFTSNARRVPYKFGT